MWQWLAGGGVGGQLETWCPAPLRPFAVSLLIDSMNGALPLAQPWLSCGCGHLGRELGRRDSWFKEATCLLELTSKVMQTLEPWGLLTREVGPLQAVGKKKKTFG